MSKKSVVIIVSILLIGLVIVGLYGTFAASSTVSGGDNVYNITLTGGSSEISIPAGSSKTVLYKITNTNKGTVQYGVVFSGDNIEVKEYSDSEDSSSGIIDYGETKFVKLLITNTGSSNSTATIEPVIGYEKGGSLNTSNLVPSGSSFVTESYTQNSLLDYIKSLYKNSNPIEVNDTTRNIVYYYSYLDENNSWGIMNDGLDITGTATGDANKGNIRYFGTKPNNYIYFNCNNYDNQSLKDDLGNNNCELWRIIGIVDGKVKIIKNETIGNLAWDQDKNINSDLTSYSNNWADASLQLMLNSSYYNGDTAGDIIYYSGSTGTVTETLNMSSIGIKNNETRKLISSSTWYLGSIPTAYSDYANSIYKVERTNSTSTLYEGNTFSINEKIGIMHASDYGYASDLNLCKKRLFYYGDDSTNCSNTNWLFNSSNQLLLNHRSNTATSTWLVTSDGYVSYMNDVYSSDSIVRPVLYLNTNLKIENGHFGTENDPYRLKLD